MTTAKEIDALEGALRSNDEGELAKAIKGLGGGYLWGSIELRAHQRIQQGEHEMAFALYRVVVDGPRPSLGAWNNLCWTLNAAKRRPDATIAKPLLERALAVGPMNVAIFHNLACAAVKYELDDLAFEAVAGAAKYGYAEMERLSKDEELAEIASDPRFLEALRATIEWTPEELEKLAVRLVAKDVTHLVHRAVMGMTFHFGGPVAETGPRVGLLYDAYIADIPEDTFQFHGHGYFKPLTKAMQTKTRNQLAKPAPTRAFLHIDFRPVAGDACDLHFEVDSDYDGEGLTVRLAFPLAEAHDPDAFEARFLRYATLSRAEAGSAGFAVSNRDSSSYEGMSWNRAALAERFLGVEMTYSWWRPGATASNHWLMWLDSELAKKVGKANFGEAKVTTTEAGMGIRASKVPPIAPRNAPADIGALPDVARALEPWRMKVNGAENIAYLARWSSSPSTSWDNARPDWKPLPSALAGVAKEAKPKKRAAKKKSFFDQ